MRNATVFTLIFVFLMLTFIHRVDAAKCTVVNPTSSRLRVAFATWMEADGKHPEGYRITGWLYVQPRKQRTFTSKNDIYIRVERDVERNLALQPSNSTQRAEYEFSLNPGNNSFTTVETSEGKIIYSSVNRSQLTIMGGFYEFTQNGTFRVKESLGDQFLLEKEIEAESKTLGGFCRTATHITQNLPVIDKTDANSTTKGVARRDAIWTAADTVAPLDTRDTLTLTVRFLNGTKKQKDLVKEVAPEWGKYAYIHFKFIDYNDRSDIRVTFTPVQTVWNDKLQQMIPIGEFYSYVGTDATYHRDSHTMALRFTDLESDAQKRGIILHEFGHALGLKHEHQHPAAQIRWNKPVVTAALEKSAGWSPERVEYNVFRPLEESKHFSTGYDPDSVMLYYYPSEWTLDGRGTKENNELSELDQYFVAMLYGHDTKVKHIPFSFSGHDWKKIGFGGYESIKVLFEPPPGKILDVFAYITEKKRAKFRSVKLANGRLLFNASIEKGAIFQYGKLEGYIEVKYIPYQRP